MRVRRCTNKDCPDFGTSRITRLSFGICWALWKCLEEGGDGLQGIKDIIQYRDTKGRPLEVSHYCRVNEFRVCVEDGHFGPKT